jgi:hypothetical protein
MNLRKTTTHLVLFLPLCLCFGLYAQAQVAEADLVFLGTVEKVEASPLPESKRNWIVHCRVEQVLSGDFPGKTFSFRVHSPAKSGLEVGNQYKIEAKRTTDGYTVDQYQWKK